MLVAVTFAAIPLLRCGQNFTLPAQNVPPENVVIVASPMSGGSPLDVDFGGYATDTDGKVVSYTLDFGDGTPPSSNPNVSHTYRAQFETVYTASLTARDDNDGISATSVDITVGGDGNCVAPGVTTVSFMNDIVPLFSNSDAGCSYPNGTCSGCHYAGAPSTFLALDGSADYYETVCGVVAPGGQCGGLVNLAAPANSLILTKATGTVAHSGGGPWANPSCPYDRVLTWIMECAQDN